MTFVHENSEKLDALRRRFPNDAVAPATFVRHYEDAARLVEASAKLPPLTGYPNVRALADEMLDQRQIVAIPLADDPALAHGGGTRWEAIRRAHAEINGMFWGPRVSIEQATANIRAWIAAELT